MSISITRPNSRVDSHGYSVTPNSIKTIRRVLRSTDPNSVDEIAAGVYINLIARYAWVNATECYVEVGWEPWYINDEIPTRYNSNNINESKFGVTGAATFKIMGQTINGLTALPPINTIADSNMIKYANDVVVPNDIDYACMARFNITGITNEKYIDILYSYKNVETYEYSVAFIDNNVLKIPRPNKYDNNIVFNKDGLNELIRNIKNYPLVSATSTLNNGVPAIEFKYGSGATATVNVGSNIEFLDPSSGTAINSTTSTTQDTGTFRVNINNKTYEVPIKGLNNNIGINLIPSTNEQDLGNSNNKWRNLYLSNNLIINNGTLSETYGIGTHQKKIISRYVGVNFQNSLEYYNEYGRICSITYWADNPNLSNTSQINLTGIQDIYASPIPNDYSKNNQGQKSANDSSWEIARDYGIRCIDYTNSSIKFIADDEPPKNIIMEIICIYS